MLKQKLEKLGRIAIGAKTPDKRAMARPWHDTGVAMRRIVFGLCLAGLLASVVWLAQRGYGLVGIGIAFLFGLGALALMRLGERGKGAVAVVLLLIVPLFSTSVEIILSTSRNPRPDVWAGKHCHWEHCGRRSSVWGFCSATGSPRWIAIEPCWWRAVCSC